MSEKQSNAMRLSTFIKATDRAKALGYNCLQDCIVQRISSGTTMGDLARKLDVSEAYLSRWMEHLGIKSTHLRKVRFWLPKAREL